MRNRGQFLAFCLFIAYSGAIEVMTARYAAPSLQYALTVSLVMLTGLVLGMVAAVRYGRMFANALIAAHPYILLLLWTILSVTWSIAPTTSLLSCLLLLLMVCAACGLVTLTSWRGLLTGIAYSAIFLGLLSLLLIPVGGLMTETHIGALKGPFPEKNHAGMIYAIGGVTAMALCFFDRHPAWLLAVGFQAILLYLTKSGTATLAFGLGISTLCAIEVLRERPRRLVFGIWIGTFALMLFGAWILNNSESILAALGEDSTFTGRDKIWSAVWLRIQQVTWTGYGYGTFWRDPHTIIQWMWYEAGYEFFTAHNTWLDIWLSLGIPGVGLIIYSLIRPLVTGLAGLNFPDDARRIAIPSLLMILFMSLTETVMGNPDGPTFFFTIVLTVKTMMPQNHTFTYHRF